MRRRHRIIAALALLLLAAAGAWWGVRAVNDVRLRRQLVGTWEVVGNPLPDGRPRHITFHPDGTFTSPKPEIVTWRVASGRIITTQHMDNGREVHVATRVRATAPGVLELRTVPAPPSSFMDWVNRLAKQMELKPPAILRRVK